MNNNSNFKNIIYNNQVTVFSLILIHFLKFNLKFCPKNVKKPLATPIKNFSHILQCNPINSVASQPIIKTQIKPGWRSFYVQWSSEIYILNKKTLIKNRPQKNKETNTKRMKLFSVIDRFYFISLLLNTFSVFCDVLMSMRNEKRDKISGFLSVAPDMIPFSVLRFFFSDKQKGREVSFIYDLAGPPELIDP